MQQHSPLAPLITVLQWALGVGSAEAPEVQLHALEQALAPLLLPPHEAVPLVAALLSLPLPARYPPLTLTPQQQKQQTLDALLLWLAQEAERQPQLLVVEDLHWVDPSTLEWLTDESDLAVVVGGYNSSNTIHLVEPCARQMPTYCVRDADDLLAPTRIRHLEVYTHTVCESIDGLPRQRPDGHPVEIVLTAGASSPDASLEAVLCMIVGWFPTTRALDDVLVPYRTAVGVV